ncbi:MAG: endolytic transglycosylase MltG [Clostridiales bacterium]|nr:endolytic transglycosylase MltG [Clostridiales bacterium]
MEDNKDKLVNSNKNDADELMEDTIVFKREPDTIVQRRTPQGQNTQHGSNQNPAIRKNAQPDVDAQHTARVQGGAVIRPLKQSSQSVQMNSNAQNQRQPANSKQVSNQNQVQQQSTRPIQGQNRQIQQPNNVQSAQQQQRAPQRPQGQLPPQVQGQPRANTQNQTARLAQNQHTPQQLTSGQSLTTPNQRYVQPQSTQNANRQGTVNRGSVQPVNQNNVQNNSARNLPIERKQVASPQPARETADFEIDDSWRRAPEKPQREVSGVRDSATSAIMSAVKAIVYIVCVIAISIPLAIFVINTANDVFAFVKDDKIIEVEIPEYATIDDIGDILGEAGVIKYPWAFKLWSNLKERNNIKNGKPPEFVAGRYEVSTQLNYDYLRATFKKRTVRSTIRITIPEGFTALEIINLFVSNGIGTYDGFVDAINNHDYDFPFIDTLPATSSERYFRLEGYLYPDTYEFYTDASEAQVIYKLLYNFDVKFQDFYDSYADTGMTIDQIITLASIIEKETKYLDEMPDISSVFHNRLQYSTNFPYLQSDATIVYAMQNDTGSRPETLTGDDTSYDSPYNTYTHRGLPPGAIANPGINAIRYALYPATSNHFYFVSNSSGRNYFATTYEEHLENIKKARDN